MGKLLDFSLKQVAAVFIIILMLVLGGVFAAFNLKVESMPDITFPEVYVVTTYPGPPQDVFQLVTKPLEKAISSLDGVQRMTSTSNDNISEIYIELAQSKKAEDAKKEIESILAGISLPERSGQPMVRSEGFASFPVYFLSMYAEESVPRQELERMLDTVILPSFQALNGLDHVDTVGDQETVLNVRLDGNALISLNMAPQDVVDKMGAALSANAAGTVEFDGQNQMLKVKSQFDSVYDLEEMEFVNNRSEIFQLKDIAQVESINRSNFTTRLNGMPAVGINLYKTKSANAVEFSGEIEGLLKQWEKQYPHISFQTIMNSAEDIKKSIHGMLREGALGALLASGMILFFLRNTRMTVIVLVSIPLSILISLLFMNFFDITLNIMTLGGLTLAIGRVVDDSIVVIENIYNHLQKAQERNESLIKMATLQVSSAITSSTLTTVAVFTPIGFVGGIVGQVFKPFAITLVCSLLASLLVAVTVIPLLTKLLVLRNAKLHSEEDKERWSVRVYRKVLHQSFLHRKKTLAASMLLFILSVILIVPILPKGFLPESESDKNMYFTIMLPKDTSMEAMDQQTKQFELIMMNARTESGEKVFDFVEAMVGYNYGTDRFAYITNIYASASPHVNANDTVEAFEDKISEAMPEGSKLEAGLFTGGAVGNSLFTYSLKGDNQEELRTSALLIKEKMQQFPELKNIKDSLSEAKTEIEVEVDKGRAKAYGMDAYVITETIREWISSAEMGEIYLDNVYYKTFIEIDSSFKNSLDKVGRLPLKTPDGRTITLLDVADVKTIGAPDEIKREDQQLVLSVTALIDSPDVGGVSDKVVAELDKISLSEGISRDVSGISEDMEDSFQQLFFAIGISILIVYLVMVITFGKAGSPLIILFSLPLAVIGGLLGLLVTGESLNVASLIGFLMLIGIVVTNAIVLIDRVEQLQRMGVGVRESLIEAGLSRLRPIIMTAGATIFALVPLALGLSAGTLISRGLAVVVIGGLITSTLLTLVVVPVLYEMNENLKLRFVQRMKRISSKKNKELTVNEG